MFRRIVELEELKPQEGGGYIMTVVDLDNEVRFCWDIDNVVESELGYAVSGQSFLGLAMQRVHTCLDKEVVRVRKRRV